MSGDEVKDQVPVDQSSSSGRPRLERHLFDEYHAIDCPCLDPRADPKKLTPIRGFLAFRLKSRHYRDVEVKP